MERKQYNMRTITGASLAVLITLAGSCTPPPEGFEELSGAKIERLDPGLDSVIRENARIEILARGFDWSEGPLWIEEEEMLIFSDVPRNIVHKWTEKEGLQTYLSPSGYTGTTPRGGETGSNGLLLSRDGALLLCQHGDRRLARMEAPLDQPAPRFTSLADNYGGKKFNSPNDAALRSDGSVFFTDPPYGLEHGVKDPARELPFHGVYRTDGQGNVTLLTDSLTRPNGIALSPDEKTLIVANSDRQKAIWYTFGLDERDSLVNPGILYNATEEARSETGSPDGLKIDRQGHIFASGPGGVWIFGKDHKLLGKIKIPGPVSNCALGDQDRSLFITADSLVLRVNMR